MNTNLYIGIPFEAHGDSQAGLDCWGLVRLFYMGEFGIYLDDYNTQYEQVSERKNINFIIDSQVDNWNKIESEDKQDGDLVVLAIGGNKCHIGIYVGNNKMLHADEKAGVVIEGIDVKRWTNRVSGFYRHTERL